MAGRARVKPKAVGAAAAVLATAAVAVFFAVRTARYDRIWADSESLWSYTIEASHDFRAYNNLARVRMEQKRWADAERLFTLGSRQTNVTSWDGLTAVYYITGRYQDALRTNDKAFALHALKAEDVNERAELNYKRGVIYLAQNRLDEGIAALTTAVSLNPAHPDARHMLDLARQAKQRGP
jgi:tetratricopeptide (TPR) repeat protein